MASALYLHPMTPLSSPNASSQQPQRPTLRRATYVHVSDLTSAYNIDHARLEQELSRVKAESGPGPGSRKVPSHSPETGGAVAAATAEEEVSVIGVEPLGDLETTLGAVAPQKRLQPPRGGFNLCVLVGSVNLVVDKRRVDQSRVRLAEVEIGDETGTVSLRARDEQIDTLEEVSVRSGAVVLRNCTLELYQGKHIRLAVTKWGKLAVYPDNVASTPPPPSKMNKDRNFSLIDLSVVASEMVEEIPAHETAYPSRQVKLPESEEGGAGISSTGSSRPGLSTLSGRALASKAGQTHTKHQPQQALRRNARSTEPRRHPRGSKGTGGGMAVHYGGIKPDSRQIQPGQIIYHNMPAYAAGYEQTIDMRQYPPHTAYTRQQEVSAQQMMLQQQYEMQHRQLQQMYNHGHQEHSHQQGHQTQQPSPMILRPMGSFDATTSAYATDAAEHHQHPGLIPGVGTSSLLVPMGMNSVPIGMIPASTPPEHYSSPKRDSPSVGQDSRSSGAMSPFPLGKMNPDATAFAPSYVASQGTPNAGQAQGNRQFSYDLSQSIAGAVYQTQSAHHPGFYAPGIMYPAPPHPMLNSPPEHQGLRTDASAKAPRRQQPSAGSTDPDASGKENLTSKP